MSENIQSISQGTYTIGQTSATNFIAGNGIKIDEPSAGTVRIGNDETVLWEGSANKAITTEDPNNFAQLRVCVKNTDTPEISTFTVDSSNTVFGMCACGGFYDGQQILGLMRGVITTSGLSFGDSKTNKIPYSNGGSKTINVAAGGWVYTKIIGINRISGSNT